MKSLLNFEQGQVLCLFHDISLRESIEVHAVLTHFFIPTLLSLLINTSFYMLLFHTSVIFLIVSIVTSNLSLLLCKQVHTQTVSIYFVARLYQGQFFSSGSRYVLSKSHCSIYLVSFLLVLVILEYICLFISNHCVSFFLNHMLNPCFLANSKLCQYIT